MADALHFTDEQIAQAVRDSPPAVQQAVIFLVMQQELVARRAAERGDD